MAETVTSPGRFIAKLRASDPTFMVNLFENGGCYHLFLLLRMIWPDAEPWYAFGQGHVYAKIGSAFYDINGRAKPADTMLAERMTVSQQREGSAFLRHRLAKHEGKLYGCIRSGR